MRDFEEHVDISVGMNYTRLMCGRLSTARAQGGGCTKLLPCWKVSSLWSEGVMHS